MASVAGSSPRAQAADQMRRLPRRGAGLQEVRQDLLADDLELLRRAEEVGLLDGDERDQVAPLASESPGSRAPARSRRARDSPVACGAPLRHLLQEDACGPAG